MTKESIILAAAWIISALLLVFLVPKKRIREAQVIFLFKQVITWIFGFITVEYGMLSYPVRLFPYATRSSFTFEYFVYPAVCVLFNLYYPKTKNKLRLFLYFSAYSTALTVIEVILKEYTGLIRYIHWNWFFSWSTFYITFYMTRVYYVWFFKRITVKEQ